MTINFAQFTPLASFSGGLLIGLAAIVLILFCGRIAGISGILGGMLQRETRAEGWRIAFLLGLIGAPVLYLSFFPRPDISLSASTPLILIAGLLVGVGTRLGSGCTSGHGVCGLSRFSPRSLAATLTFMVVGFATATLLGWLRG
ncbi:YeeE/YedE family protein [Mangrovibacter phragmitis]|uniref:YeeE/YedE family protein n=1 Tax=Mangrovibacter phragmitis TaxID=1691903 RepID=A0A1B7L5P7_9ENTR|nr:YeeE/YedE family protein [Mangrovibacter phragmitis]OAT77662.1 YeeE/YedE family protein [Mangrovibacter phragmitis]